jgi:hypothetical protein
LWSPCREGFLANLSDFLEGLNPFKNSPKIQIVNLFQEF